MFYQTYTTHKPPSACTPVTPGCDAMVPSPAACGLQRTAHTLQCIVNGNDSAVFPSFIPGDLDLWPWHSNSFERGTKHVFGTNLFSHSRHISLTNKKKTEKTNKQLITDSAKNRTLLACCKNCSMQCFQRYNVILLTLCFGLTCCLCCGFLYLPWHICCWHSAMPQHSYDLHLKASVHSCLTSPAPP